MTPPMNLTNLPNSVLETFIPGYSLVSRFILVAFGFDVSLVVSVSVVIFWLHYRPRLYLPKNLGADPQAFHRVSHS